jgi:predicted nuclease of restriction endonuclease-like (RecB) superfamily
MPGMAATTSPPPAGYGELLGDLQRQVRSSQAAAHRAVNAEMLALYRTIGRILLDRVRDGWPAEVIDRMGADLRAEFPDMRALSPGNLDYMRRFAEVWPDPAVAPPLQHLPWGHIRVLLDEVADPHVRDWYAAAAVRSGWSQNVLLHQILNRTHERGFCDDPRGSETGAEQVVVRFQAPPAVDPDRLRADVDGVVDERLSDAEDAQP